MSLAICSLYVRNGFSTTALQREQKKAHGAEAHRGTVEYVICRRSRLSSMYFQKHAQLLLTRQRGTIIYRYVRDLRDRGISSAAITQEVYGICRYLEFCASNGKDPYDRSYEPIVSYIVALERRRIEKAGGRSEAIRGSLWRHAREVFRQVVQYVLFVLWFTCEEAYDRPAWDNVAVALTVAGMPKPTRGATALLVEGKHAAGRPWCPTWVEFEDIVARMHDPRARVAALVMYGAQLPKETVVRMRRQDVRWSGYERARGMSEADEGRLKESTVVEVPGRVMSMVEYALEQYDSRDDWLCPTYDRERRGRPMTANSVARIIAAEAEIQGIPMTCHRIQLAGAVDALRCGQPEEEVLQRLGAGRRWRSELRRVFQGR